MCMLSAHYGTYTHTPAIIYGTASGPLILATAFDLTDSFDSVLLGIIPTSALCFFIMQSLKKDDKESLPLPGPAIDDEVP